MDTPKVLNPSTVTALADLNRVMRHLKNHGVTIARAGLGEKRGELWLDRPLPADLQEGLSSLGWKNVAGVRVMHAMLDGVSVFWTETIELRRVA